jgi:anti-anti-sigma factor
MSTTHGTHWLEREDFGDVTVVRLKTPPVLTDPLTHAVFDPVRSLVSRAGRNRLVLNLAAAEYLPSMALGQLALLNRMAQGGGGRRAVCHLSPGVKEALEHTHLDDVLTVYATEEEAVRSFS